MTRNKKRLVTLLAAIALLLANQCRAKSVFDFDDVRLPLELKALENEYHNSLAKRGYGGIRLAAHADKTKRLWLIQFYTGCALLIEPECLNRSTIRQIAAIAKKHDLRLLHSVDLANEHTTYYRIDLFPYAAISTKPAELAFDILKEAFKLKDSSLVSVKRYWKSDR